MGVAAGMIHKATREIIRKARALTNSSIERQAVALARTLPACALRVEEEKGYAAFTAAGIGAEREVDAIARLAAAWTTDPTRSNSDKPFLRNILRTADLFDHPAIMQAALNDELFGAVSAYLGQVPWLVSLQVWWTPPNQTAIRSQLYHYDHRDTRQAKVFINLAEVDEDAGPLHFLPASSSLKVDRKIGYTQDDYTDEEVARCVAPEEVVRTTGPAGAGFIVDTARCLHYGSRGNRKDRLVLMVSFARINCVSRGSGCEVLDPVRKRLVSSLYPDDPARAFAVEPR